MASRREIQQRLADVKPNLLDRIINVYDPAKATSRLRARYQFAMLGGYHSGSKSRRALSEWSVSSGSADADQLPDLPIMRERSRDLVRNSPLAAGIINTKVTSVVGTGIKVQSRIDRKALPLTDAQADEFEAAAEREFRAWAESQECDAARSINFYDFQDLLFRSVLESGDAFVTLPYIKRKGDMYGTKIQLIEGDRVCNPNNAQDTETLAGGIERDANTGAPIAYHITKTHPGNNYAYDGEWQRVLAYGSRTGRRQVLHLFKKLRPGQSRGMPDLAPVIEALKQLSRYTDAEIAAAVVNSFFTVFIKSSDGTGGFAPMEPTSESGAKTSDEDIKLGAGAVVSLADGEDVTFANPTRPSTALEPFIQAILRQIGTAVEIPYEVLIKHFTASYSASQAALLEAWRFFMARRQWLVRLFCQPVYEAVITEGVMSGRIKAPGFLRDASIRKAYLGTEWIGPARGHIDEVKAVNAAKIRIDEGLSTRYDEAASLGKDWDRLHEQRVKEEKLRKELSSASSVTPPQPIPPEEQQDAQQQDEES